MKDKVKGSKGNSKEIEGFTPNRMATIKRQIKTCVGEAIDRLEYSYVAGEKVKWCSLFGKSGSSSKGETKNNHVIQQSHFQMPKRSVKMFMQKCTQMLVVALFRMDKK